MNQKNHACHPGITDCGKKPMIVNINSICRQNSYYRTTLWTGKFLQVTLMSLPVNGEIGLEMHPDVDQLIQIENGYGFVMMGTNKDHLNNRQKVNSDYAILIPAGTWHNILNAGMTPLKLYSVYAPPNHPFGTINQTKEDSEYK